MRADDERERPGTGHALVAFRPSRQRQLVFWPALTSILAGYAWVLFRVLRVAGVEVRPWHGLPQTVANIAMLLTGAIVLRSLLRLARRRGAGLGWRDELVGVGMAIVEVALIAVAMAVLAVAFMWTKVMIPVLNPRLWDALLAGVDRILCLGVNPTEFLLTAFEGAPRLAAVVVDVYYSEFVLCMQLVAAWFLVDPRPGHRRAFALALVTVWMLGGWWHLAMPSLGPAYCFPDLPSRIARLFPLAGETQQLLLHNYRAVHRLVAGTGARITPALAIAAIPSLHVGVLALYYLWARITGSKLRPLLLAMTLLTWMGSVATGWHWAVDGLAGIAVAAAAAWVGSAWRRRFPGPPEEVRAPDVPGSSPGWPESPPRRASAPDGRSAPRGDRRRR